MLLLRLDLGRLERHYHNVRVEYDPKKMEATFHGDGGSGPPPVDVTFNVEVPVDEQARIIEQATAQALYALLRPER